MADEKYSKSLMSKETNKSGNARKKKKQPPVGIRFSFS